MAVKQKPADKKPSRDAGGVGRNPPASSGTGTGDKKSVKK